MFNGINEVNYIWTEIVFSCFDLNDFVCSEVLTIQQLYFHQEVCLADILSAMLRKSYFYMDSICWLSVNITSQSTGSQGQIMLRVQLAHLLNYRNCELNAKPCIAFQRDGIWSIEADTKMSLVDSNNSSHQNAIDLILKKKSRL